MSTRVTELSIEELRTLIEDAVRRVLHEETQDKQDKQITERPPLDIPVLDVGPWPDGLELISREEMYDDDGR